MSSSPSAAVLRGAAARTVPSARLDANLRDEARAAAQAEGYAAGYAAGRSAAMAEVAAEAEVAAAAAAAELAQRLATVESAAQALHAAARDLQSQAVPTYADVADRLGGVAYDLVEILLSRELELRPDTVADAVQRVATAAPDDGLLTLRLNPADVRALAAEGVDLETLAGRPVTVRTDATVAAGDARASHGATRVDGSLAAALGRVREVLAP